MNNKITLFTHRLPRLALIFLGLTLISLMFVPIIQAAPDASIVVDSVADNTTAGDSNCTLREAIANANGDSDTTSGDCTAGSGDDTITFSAGISGGTITLGGAELSLTSNITINGSSAGMTIDGNNTSRVFLINSGTVEISNLTITNGTGYFGGGLYAQSVSIATVRNSTFFGNSASYGGGLASTSQGVVTIENSTFSNNVASGGSAVWSGSLHSSTEAGTIIVNSTTIVGGSSTGTYGSAIGAYQYPSFVGTLTIKNSLVQKGSNETRVAYYSGVDSTQGGTIIDDGNNMTNSIIGNPGFTVEAGLLLNPLFDNGGDTKTHMPRVDSPAVNGGDCTTGPTTDQRGETRPQNTLCDIGSVEVQSGEEATQHCSLVAGEGYVFLATGAYIEIETLGTLSCLDVSITDGVHPTATANIPAPYITIDTTPAIASGYQVTLTLLHVDQSDPKICKYPGGLGGDGWDCDRDGFDSNTVWRGGITSFSDWAVGNLVGPTSVNLQSVSATSAATGGIAAAFGAVTLALGGFWLRLRSRKNANG